MAKKSSTRSPGSKPIQCVIGKQVDILRFTRIAKLRKYAKPVDAVRELAIERANQIDAFGDIPLAPASASS